MDSGVMEGSRWGSYGVFETFQQEPHFTVTQYCIQNSDLQCTVHHRKGYLQIKEEMRKITLTKLHIGRLSIRNPYRASYPSAFKNTLLLRDFNS